MYCRLPVLANTTSQEACPYRICLDRPRSLEVPFRDAVNFSSNLQKFESRLSTVECSHCFNLHDCSISQNSLGIINKYFHNRRKIFLNAFWIKLFAVVAKSLYDRNKIILRFVSPCFKLVADSSLEIFKLSHLVIYCKNSWDGNAKSTIGPHVLRIKIFIFDFTRA